MSLGGEGEPRGPLTLKRRVEQIMKKTNISELKNYPVDAIIIASVAFHREIEKNIATAFGQNYKVYTLLES